MVTQIDPEKTVAEMMKPVEHGPLYDPVGIGGFYERNGYYKAVSGEEDFHRVVKGFQMGCYNWRGVMFVGANGCGKSCAMRAIYNMRRKCHYDSEWVDCGNEESVDWLKCDDVMLFDIYLDDFGAERFKYGDCDRVGEFITAFHRRRRRDQYLHVTTNLTAAQINERYGGRVLDRLKELCVVVPLLGSSKRKAIIIK